MWTFKHTPQPPEWRVNWPAIHDDFAWIRDMQGTMQEPQWHAEGDVHIHTRMVAEAMAGEERWRALNELDRHITFAAALLHDVAKPACTKFEDGRWTSPNHTRVGERMTRLLMWKGEAGDIPDFQVREHVAKLVRYHGLPLNFLSKPDPARAIIEASLHANLNLLSLLALADVTGRECEGKSELLDRIALFSEFSQEQECLHAPKAFASDHHRFIYFNAQKPYDYIPYDTTRFEVTIMSGLPASGKTTWAKSHAAEQPIISLDELRHATDIDPADDQGPVITAAKEQAKTYLRSHRPFIWDATNLTRDMRRGLISLLSNYGAKSRIVYVEAPWEELHRRNRSRAHPVPESIIDRLATRLEMPSLTEAHRVDYVSS